MTAKDLDYFEMKHAIQQRPLEEFRGLSSDEQRRRAEELIHRDPMLARAWQRARHLGLARPATSET